MQYIVINNQRRAIVLPITLQQLLAQEGYIDGIAVAVNQEFIPRSSYADYQLTGNEKIDIVAPMQGG